MKIVIFLAVLVAVTVATSDHWAVLVAGSSGYGNYRHQADICHAYQILIKNGMKAENIITFAFDDIANNSENPFPGQMFNKPNGTDVYAGCNIDYKGSDVTPENFIKVLEGDASVGGKYLKSTENSEVFINFADHGGVGLIAFPSSYLYAKDFQAALDSMHTKNMYKKMVIYIEACESGSMFTEEALKGKNIFATTAANASESSWGYYCPPDDVVNGKELNSCLGDLYSITWMEDSDANKACSETIATQFEHVLKRVTKSHPLKFGDESISALPIGDFEGVCTAEEKDESFMGLFLAFAGRSEQVEQKESVAWDSRDIEVRTHFEKYMRTKNITDATKLTNAINNRIRTDHIFHTIHDSFGINSNDIEAVTVQNFDCYKAVNNKFERECGKVDDYALKYLKTFAHLCNSLHYDMIAHKIATICNTE